MASEAVSVAPHFNNAPSISDFVVYAERSVTLGSLDRTLLGDIGVHSSAPAGFGPQLRVGNNAALSAFTSLLSPSVSIGTFATVGVVQTDALTNSGGAVAQAAFPEGTMPSVPSALIATPGGSNVTVGAFQVQTINPGSYAALNVTGTVFLNPGTYSFASVTLANNAHLYANLLGTTSIRVEGTLSTGSASQILPVAPQTAGSFVLSVSGATATIGAGSAITALLTVPNGVLTLGDNVVATGAFAAHDFVAGNNVALGYQGGFSPTSIAGTPCAVNLTAEFPLPPLVPVQGIATPIAPMTFAVPAQIPVTTGSPVAGAALLTFVPLNAVPVICTYVALGLPATAFGLQACSNGATAGSIQVARSFTLQPTGSFNFSLGPVTLSAPLNAPASTCDDQNLCTTDSCGTDGVCASADVACQPSDPFHLAGMCAASTGVCSNPPAPPPLGPAIPTTPLPVPPPSLPGCYVNTFNGWQAVPCATDAEVDAQFPHPQLQAGIQSTAPADGSAAPLVFGQLETIFASLGVAPSNGATEMDTFSATPPKGCPAGRTNKPNVFSVQNNTNQFKGTNGDSSGMQFAIQSNGTTNGICIWNVDVKTQKYPKTCYLPPPAQRAGGLRAFDSANIAAFIDTSTNTIKMVVDLSWVQPGAKTQYAIVEPDAIGLTNNWFNVSGAVLGGGSCSQAVFTNGEVLTRIAASSCAGDTSAGDPVCPGSTLQPNATVVNTGGTAETNNLISVAAPAISFPNADLAVSSYTSTTTGGCLGPALAYVKDRDGDNGAEPSNLGGQPFWESPDIFLVPQGVPVDVNGKSSETLVTPGSTFDVYVRVHNDLGCSPVTSAKAQVYLADPSALSTAWQTITTGYEGGTGNQNGVTVPTGGQALVGPFTFTASAANVGDGHKCLIAAIQADGEPAAASNFDAPNSNQVGQRNVQLTDCKFPLTNATASGGQVALTLTVSPLTTKPSLSGPTDIEVTFDDPDQSWNNIWATQPDAGTNFTVSHTGSSTVVRLGINSVTLKAAPIAPGETRTAAGSLSLPAGAVPTSLSLSATLTEGGTTVVSNGGTCQGTAAPIIQ